VFQKFLFFYHLSNMLNFSLQKEWYIVMFGLFFFNNTTSSSLDFLFLLVILFFLLFRSPLLQKVCRYEKTRFPVPVAEKVMC